MALELGGLLGAVT
jgi:hypothetical protein